MSEPKKPGFKDIGDLRSKLGLAPTAAPLAAPPPADDDDDATSIVGAVTDEQIAAMEVQPAEPAPVIPAAPPAARPSAPQLPGAAPVSPLVPPPPDAPDGARAGQAGPYVSPSHDAIASAPPPMDLAGSLNRPLAAPPGGPGPLALPPPEMLGGLGLGAGDATMAAFAPVARTNRKIWVSAIIFAATLALVFGYMVGDINKDRKIINKRISDCKRVVTPVKKAIGKLKPMIKSIRNANPDKVDWELAEQLATFDGKFPIEEVITDNLLFGPTITGDLMQFIHYSNELHKLSHDHGRMTLKSHKKYLKDFDQATEALHSDKGMFVFHANGRGALVTVEGRPEKRGKVEVVPVRFVTGAEREAEVANLIAIDKRDLIGASGPNVMELYSGRIRQLRTIAEELDKLYERLLMRLQTEAERDPIIAM